MFNKHEHMSLKEMRSLVAASHITPAELVKCALGIREAEIQTYYALLKGSGGSVQQIAERMEKSRPTAQRLLQDLVAKGLATRSESLIGRGGYLFEYNPVPPETVRETIKGLLNIWHDKMQRYLENFPEEIAKEARRKPR